MKITAAVKSLGILASATIAFTAQAVLIDDFDTGQQGPFLGQFTTVGAPAFNSGSEQAPTANIIGGERDVFVQNTNAMSTTVDTGPIVGGNYAHSQGAGALAYSIVSWDGVDSTATPSIFGGTVQTGGNAIDATVGLGGVDLIADGTALQFQTPIVDLDAGTTANVIFYVFSSDTSYSTFTLELTDAVLPNTVFAIEQTDFVIGESNLLLDGVTQPQFLPATNATTAADFTNVSAIALLLDGTAAPNFDVAFNLLEVRNVPVAPSFLMLAFGLAGIVIRRRGLAAS